MSASRAALYLSTAAGLALACPAFAQDATTLDEITVSASSQPVKVSETGASVTVLTGDDLDAGGNLSLAEQLARTPGVSFSRNGGMGTLTTLRLRGLGGAYVGARLDGIDITDPSSTQTSLNFGTLTTAGVSRVEVLRGSQSALYGANAVGGVVDITSWRPTEEGLSGAASAEGGSNGTWSGTLSAGLKDTRGELAFSAGRTITDGISAAKNGTEDDGFQTSNASVYGRYDLSETFSIGANGFWRDSHTDIDNSVYDYTTYTSTLMDTPDTQDSTLRGGRIFTDFTLGAVSNQLSYARSRTDRVIDYPESDTQYNYKGTRNALEYTGKWTANEIAAFTWGASHDKENSDIWGSYADGNGSAWTNSVYGEALLTPRDDLDVSLALRNDVHETYGGKTTGRAAVAWHATDDWIIRGVASTGYRAPSLYELNSSYGSKDLTPEESKSFELGAEKLFTGGSVQATLFKTTIKDRILWDQASMNCASAQSWGYAGCYAQVDGDTTAQGLELTANYDLTPDWKLTGNYTYTDAKQDADTGRTRAVQVPRNTFNIGLDGTFGGVWHAGASVTRVADVVDSDGDLPDYTLVNVSMAYDITEKTQAYVRIENLFDEDYETIRDYGQPGRQAFFGVRAKF